ncbi:unnamed protein product [Diatraea saccharalis]|uniref:Uncharacterized protein n=1 Tax=Diatraea saccharalis TaxID=40085 RepID=A0A9N9N093_9NEOP|nr:unnamed protein product [Diatraea saccharalis]
MLEEWEDRNTRKKRITRSGGNPIQSSSHQIDSRKVLKLHPQKIAKQSDSILSQRQKQKDYMERKKILWSLAHGSSRVNLKKDAFKTKNKVEEGFQSDLDNH